jgi:hypothetical protein
MLTPADIEKENWMRTLNGTRLLAIALLAPLLVQAEVVTYNKSKTLDKKGKEVNAVVAFDGDRKELRVAYGKEVLFNIPFDTIQKISYEKATRHRVKEGAIVMIASLGVGAIVMATKSKNYWLYVDYKQDGQDKDVTLKMDKSEYEKMMATAKSQTGKQIETLDPKAKGQQKGKEKTGSVQ